MSEPVTVTCTGCSEQIYPAIQLGLQGGGKKYICPQCHCTLPQTILDVPQPLTSVTVLHRPNEGAELASQILNAARRIPEPGAPLDPEAQIRARLDWIDARLAEAEPLRAEQAKLRRMLDAAAPPSAHQAKRTG